MVSIEVLSKCLNKQGCDFQTLECPEDRRFWFIRTKTNPYKDVTA